MPVTNYEQKIHLLLSDARGQYIPRDFTTSFDMDLWHLNQKDVDVLLKGPEFEWYWDTWNEVERTAYYIVESYSIHHDVPNLIGKWTLYHGGDLWAIHESMTEEDWLEWRPC